MEALFGLLQPAAQLATSEKLPVLKQLALPCMCGYLATHTKCSFEPDALGSVRVQAFGSTHVLLMRAAEAFGHFKSIDDAKAALKTMTTSQAQVCDFVFLVFAPELGNLIS